jgi:Ca-activated chloride channel family protein
MQVVRFDARWIALLVICGQTLLPVPIAGTQASPLSVRITSPLGRTGLPGTVRIVAQVRHSPAAPPGQVRFFVDDRLLGAVEDGPPYAVEWVDENPFERRTIAVEVTDTSGNAARDDVVLEPYEVSEAAEVNSVLLETSVQEKSGRFVKGLAPSEFQVFEDGVPQVLDLVSHEAVGATFGLMVDSSASMSRRLDFVQRTAATLTGYMTERDRMIVAPFSKELGPLTGPTDDRDTILEGIRAIRPVGGTSILDALVEMARRLESAEGRRAIVLITDGYDEHSTRSFEEALAAVRSAGATLYVVGIGGVAGISIKGERLLRRLALETGGRCFLPARETQLAEVHDVLTDDVQNRYLLTYTPRNQKTDGTWRAVTVRTATPDLAVRTRPGYFAPKPPPIKPAIEFTAVDASGRYLDLTVEDLEVVENGMPQEVESFQEAVQPVSIVLALDASGSMRKKEAEVIQSAREFVAALQERDSLALILFGDRSLFAHDLSQNREFSYDAIGEYRAIGGTALYDALSDALIRLRRAPGRRVVVVMTDGRDENNAGTAPGSLRRLDDVMKHAKETGASIFTIGLGSNVDRSSLETLADVSGGRAFFPSDVTELSAEFRRVVDDLRRRYVVGYTSSIIQRDGTWREVQIRIKTAEDATVRSSGGYFAPAK